MGRLIIDGNSFFEIDEECLKKNKHPLNCGLEDYIKNECAKDYIYENYNRNEKSDG